MGFRKIAALGMFGLASIVSSHAQENQERFSASFGVGPFRTIARTTPATSNAALEQLKANLPSDTPSEVIDSLTSQLPVFNDLRLEGKKYTYEVSYTTDTFWIHTKGIVTRGGHASDGSTGQTLGEEDAGIGGHGNFVELHSAFLQSRAKPALSIVAHKDFTQDGSPYGSTKDSIIGADAKASLFFGKYNGNFIQGGIGLGVEHLQMVRAQPTPEEPDPDKASKINSTATRLSFIGGVETRAYMKWLEVRGNVSFSQPIATSHAGLPLESSISAQYNTEAIFWVRPASHASMGVGFKYEGSVGREFLAMPDGSRSLVHRSYSLDNSLQLTLHFKLNKG